MILKVFTDLPRLCDELGTAPFLLIRSIASDNFMNRWNLSLHYYHLGHYCPDGIHIRASTGPY